MRQCRKCLINKTEEEFRKDKSYKCGRGSICKQCNRAATKEYYQTTRGKSAVRAYQQSEKHKAYREKYRKSEENKASQQKYINKEGYGVYIAKYPSGVYIGEGRLIPRRANHLTGHSVIAKTLGEKAKSFEVKIIGNKLYCKEMEKALIRCYTRRKIAILNTIAKGKSKCQT